MKSKSILLIALLALAACNTKNKDMNTVPITDSNTETITAANTLAQQVKAIKHYADEPLYYIFVNHNQCFFQILVNDVPVFQYFQDGQIMTPIILNNYINHSGKQTITYKLYPQTKFETGEGLTELTNYTKMKIDLYVRNNADVNDSFEGQKEILTHQSATKEDGKTFIGDGKDYYEFSFDFEAKVPYELPDWNESQDLSKMDQDVLLKKTEAAYQYFWNIINTKKQDEYFRLGFASNKAQVISEYFDEKMIEDGLRDELKDFTEPSFKLQPLENYKMKLYGNGKIVCLEQNSEDLRLKNRWAIWGKYKTAEGETRVSFSRLYLHMPKGKDTFEIIR
ncbi:hypothetical protein ACJVDH_13025 [Pedobacter sp. AW1-32]|uniref:hypothetical protein n=1 Tax=Pedobacter sp. AW1-32 TaxID=3383026 RepID=UPI003FF04B68